MNRLILVGNGFDLAHRLKTDYNSFIIWYLKKCYDYAENYSKYEDELILIGKNWREPVRMGNVIRNIDEFIEYHYKHGIRGLITNAQIQPHGPYQSYNAPFTTKIKSSILEKILLTCSDKNWVDIETQFYSILKEILKESLSNNQNKDYKKDLAKLNVGLKNILTELEKYLSSISCINFNDEYAGILTANIVPDEIINKTETEPPNDIVILNFNYTDTVNEYLDQILMYPVLFKSITVNHIHGKIGDTENPLIFGFGDELDEDYKKMELTENNNFFEYIKSFWYFKTSNYQNLIRFLQADEYQVFILGHSCGLSDRTLLNMIFEHSNCKSIKIYYHGDRMINNYKTLTQEISRHFKDKVSMRSKIVPFDKSKQIPQA